MSELYNEQKINQQFEREFSNKQKLKQLQGPVFKNYTIKKSISVIHPKSHSPQQQKPKKSQFFIPLIHSEKKQAPHPAIKTISFGNQKRDNSNIKSARTLSQFTPRVTLHTHNSNSLREEKLLEKMKKLQFSDLKKAYETKPKLHEIRDSQTLLRKNTLFLVNCLKTRYKQRKNAHVGEHPEAANFRVGNLSERRIQNPQYQQRFQYMEQAKQRLLQAKTVKVIDQTRSSRLSPLLPEPWQTDRGFY